MTCTAFGVYHDLCERWYRHDDRISWLHSPTLRSGCLTGPTDITVICRASITVTTTCLTAVKVFVYAS